jgi:mRNA interferase RelE/StbE
MYEVRVTRRAARDLEGLQGEIARRLQEALQALKQWPNHGRDVKRLTGEWAGQYRLRVGPYRAIFDVYEQQKKILVTRVGTRQRVYR